MVILITTYSWTLKDISLMWGGRGKSKKASYNKKKGSPHGKNAPLRRKKVPPPRGKKNIKRKEAPHMEKNAPPTLAFTPSRGRP